MHTMPTKEDLKPELDSNKTIHFKNHSHYFTSPTKRQLIRKIKVIIQNSIPDDISHKLCLLSHCTNAGHTFCEHTVQNQIPTVQKSGRLKIEIEEIKMSNARRAMDTITLMH
jgi:hypothetical protein